MKKQFIGALLLSSGVLLSAANLPYIRAERASAVYKTGEEIVFRVTGVLPGVHYTINDGVKCSAPLPLGSEIRCKATRPGFVLVTADCGKDAKGKALRAYAGAAVEPEKIEAGTKLPADFDEFWERELANMRKAPLVITQKPVDAKLLPEGVKAFDVTITRGEITATGFVAFPADAKKGTLPGCLTFLGASKVTAELPIPVKMAQKEHVLAFNLNFHGLPNFWPRTPEKLRANKALTANYRYNLAEDKQKYAMRKIFLRTVLAAEYLMQHPLFNGEKLAAVGGSLGGCQALVCSALVPQVTFCVSQATAMCDHAGVKAKHLPGWPALLENVPQAAANAPYFDVVNFMHRVKCPVYMAVGFIDTTCPPASTYAAYNTLKSQNKVMGHTVTGAHGGKLDPKDMDVFNFWDDKAAEHLKGK